MDDRTRFKFVLQGKTDRGYLEFWCLSFGDLAGIIQGVDADSAAYVVGGRDGKFELIEDYAVGKEVFYTLGKEVSHKELIDILAGKVDGKYHDPEFAARDDILRQRRNG